jgi:hypothetical protein
MADFQVRDYSSDTFKANLHICGYLRFQIHKYVHFSLVISLATAEC